MTDILQKERDLVTECVKNGINVSVTFKQNVNRLAFEIHLGSKTGIGTLYYLEDKLFLETRYGSKSEVSSFDDIATIAYEWFVNYKDREPFNSPDPQWADIFVNKGWLKIEKKYVVAK